MGSIDAAGVWIYSDDDHIVPISTYMNLGQNSVSEALGDLRTELTPTDTGWYTVGLRTSISNASGWTTRVLRLGRVVYMEGAITGLTVNTSTTINAGGANGGITLPSQFCPGQNYENLLATGGNLATQIARIQVTTAGGIVVTALAQSTSYVMGTWVAGS